LGSDRQEVAAAVITPRGIVPSGRYVVVFYRNTDLTPSGCRTGDSLQPTSGVSSMRTCPETTLFGRLNRESSYA
jgi:hypothetical protein